MAETMEAIKESLSCMSPPAYFLKKTIADQTMMIILRMQLLITI